MKALIVVDMLNDFYTGKLANPDAKAIVPKIQQLLAHARHNAGKGAGHEADHGAGQNAGHDAGWVVVYSNDAHLATDPEIRVWGEHAMAGTPGAAVIDELAPTGGTAEIISPKRFYGAFDETGLHEQLQAYGVTEVVLTGQHTHCCVRHSAYGAFLRDYTITVPSDAVCVFPGVDQQAALDYLKSMYGARITTTPQLLAPGEASA